MFQAILAFFFGPEVVVSFYKNEFTVKVAVEMRMHFLPRKGEIITFENEFNSRRFEVVEVNHKPNRKYQITVMEEEDLPPYRKTSSLL